MLNACYNIKRLKKKKKKEKPIPMDTMMFQNNNKTKGVLLIGPCENI